MTNNCESPSSKLGCINAALALVGDKWSPLLLKALAESETGQLRFGELEHELSPISPRTLSQRLSMLHDAGVIETRCYCEHPQRYCYALTDKGRDLLVVIEAMVAWSAQYAPTESTAVAS
jgi:DNA-binding HxlR family transcriptional regulator